MRVLQIQKEQSKSVTIRFPESVHASLKRLATENRVSFNALIVSLLSEDITDDIVIGEESGVESTIAPDEMNYDPEIDG